MALCRNKSTAISSALALALISGAGSLALAQDATRLRPALDVTGNNNTNNDDPNAPTQPVPRTNAPQPIRLLSNQPAPPPPPPPRPPRRQPDPNAFEPLGVKVGAFRAFPVLETNAVFTDNVNTTTTQKQTDFAAEISPSLRLESQWTRHLLELNLSSAHIFYANSKDLNTTSADINALLRLDVRTDTTWTTTAGYTLSQTSNASSQVPGTAIGTRGDHELSFSTALAHRANRLQTTLTLGANWLFSENLRLVGGGIEDNADREYIEPTATLRLGYDISPTITPFVQVGYAPRFYRRRVDRNGNRRNSHGLTAQAGFAFNPNPIWSGEVAVTYEFRDYKDPALVSADIVGLNANLVWRPTALTTFTFTAATTLDENISTNSPGIRNYDFTADITHQFRQNLRANLTAAVNYDDYIGVGGGDLNLTLTAGMAYAFRREIELTAEYTHNHFRSSAAGRDYNENRFTTGLRFRL